MAALCRILLLTDKESYNVPLPDQPQAAGNSNISLLLNAQRNLHGRDNNREHAEVATRIVIEIRKPLITKKKDDSMKKMITIMLTLAISSAGSMQGAAQAEEHFIIQDGRLVMKSSNAQELYDREKQVALQTAAQALTDATAEQQGGPTGNKREGGWRRRGGRKGGTWQRGQGKRNRGAGNKGKRRGGGGKRYAGKRKGGQGGHGKRGGRRALMNNPEYLASVQFIALTQLLSSDIAKREYPGAQAVIDVTQEKVPTKKSDINEWQRNLIAAVKAEQPRAQIETAQQTESRQAKMKKILDEMETKVIAEEKVVAQEEAEQDEDEDEDENEGEDENEPGAAPEQTAEQEGTPSAAA
jgi:hypothetical protein